MTDFVTGAAQKPVWPPLSERPRLDLYERNEDLFQGEHREVFTLPERDLNLIPLADARRALLNRRDPFRPYIAANMLGKLSNLIASRLASDGFDITLPEGRDADHEFLSYLKNANNLDVVLGDLVREQSWRGDICLRVVYHGGDVQAIEIAAVDPKHVYPETDPLNEDTVVAANIDQVVWSAQQPYLWRERHELRDGASWVLNQLFVLTVDSSGKFRCDFAADDVPLETLPALADKLPEVATGIASLLVFFIDAESDYSEALLSLQAEYNHRMTQRAAILDKHAEPTRYGPMPSGSALTPDGMGGFNVDLNKLKYIVLGDGDAPPGILTWDAQLAAVENALHDYKADFAMTAGVDAIALFPNDGQVAASGTALRRQQMTTQGTVLARHPVFVDLLQHVFAVSSELARVWPLAWQPTTGELSLLAPEDITIKLGDGLPPDRAELLREQMERYLGGAQTLEAALMAMDGSTQQVAANKAKAIQSEKQAAKPVTPGGGLPLTSFQPFRPTAGQ